MNNFELEFNFHKKNNPISKWKIFFFTFMVAFLLTTAQNLGFKGWDFKTFVPSKNHVMPKILPKLEKRPNTFKLNKTASLITDSYASSYDFDNAKAYVAIDYDNGKVIEEKNMSSEYPIASLTKLMTAVVSLDLAKPSDKITISKQAANESPTTIGVVQGQKMTVEELLNAALLTSANDAAEALRDGINSKYGENIFIRAMNKKARFLGLNNSDFSNPQGFDNVQNFSSAEDLSILTKYALTNYPLIAQIVKKDYQFIPSNNDHKQFDLYNWNGLLDVYPGVEGVKIGNTDQAEYTSIILSKREGKKVLVVIIGAPGIIERDLWASQLLDLSFQKLAGLNPIQVSESNLYQKYSTWKYWN